MWVVTESESLPERAGQWTSQAKHIQFLPSLSPSDECLSRLLAAGLGYSEILMRSSAWRFRNIVWSGVPCKINVSAFRKALWRYWGRQCKLKARSFHINLGNLRSFRAANKLGEYMYVFLICDDFHYARLLSDWQATSELSSSFVRLSLMSGLANYWDNTPFICQKRGSVIRLWCLRSF